MTAQEYVKELLARHDVDWITMHSNDDVVVVEFLYSNPEAMQNTLETVGDGILSEVRLLSTGNCRCSFVIKVAPDALNAPTLADAFAELTRSTAAFHERFETRKHSDMVGAWDVMDEEFGEVVNEIASPPYDKVAIAKELSDLLVTMLGVALHAGISEAELVEALLDTARKNDDKTLLNCTWYKGKVTRNEKLPKDADNGQ